MRAVVSALPSLAALLCVAANAADAPLLDCVEPIARAFHVRIVDTSGHAAPITCVPLQPRSTLEQAMDRLLQPSGLAWRRLDDGTLEIIAAPPPSRVKLPALDIEGDPVAQVERPDSALATALVERASAATSLDRRWLDTAPLLGFNQLGWYAPNVYGAGQSLAIRGIERDTDYFPALTVTFDGVELGTRLLDDELVPLEDVTNLNLARGPRTFESGEGAQAGAISLKTAAPAAEPITSIALGIGNLDARNGAIAWSGPLSASGLAATIALDEHELPGFVRQRAVPEANVEKRRNDFGRVKLSYAPDSGLSAQLAALALSGDSSDRQVVAPTPGLGQPPGAFDPFERDSDASNPTVAQTHARGAAGFVRYDQRDRWALDAHASITKISRDLTEFPRGTKWSDYELRRRLGVTASEHPAPDWTILAALDHDYIATRFATPLSSGQLYFNYFAAATDSASVWIEHSWNPVWKTGLGVRWSHERTTEFDTKNLWHAYQVPIPLAAVEWSPGTDHVFTLSYGTGYRSGGQIYTGIITFNPERSENLELAWRAQWFGGALHTTLSAFDGEIHDRYTYYLSSPAGDPLLASVRSRGLEFELDANVSELWQLRAGIGVLDSRFSSFVYRHGDPTSEAPPQTATLGARYGRAHGWYAAADAYHAAAARYYNPAGRLPAYSVLSFRIGYRAAQCDTALIATNALDAEYVERIQLSPGNESGYRLGDPRRIELRVKWSW